VVGKKQAPPPKLNKEQFKYEVAQEIGVDPKKLPEKAPKGK
jgi:hypothetical protein